MDLHFKDFINYDKRIGKMLIVGLEGTGKTLLLSRIAIGKMLHGFEDCVKSYGQTDYYNSLGMHLSKNYQHCCFSNFDIKCVNTIIPDRKSYVVDPFRLGFFREDYETDFYPPESLFCITEGFNYFNAYMYNKFHPTFIGYLKTGRQARIDMCADSQEFGDFCTKFRQICSRFIYLEKETEPIFDAKGILVNHRLFVVEWKNYRDVNVFLKNGTRQNCKTYELLLDMPCWGSYDTEFCKYLHLKGRERQDYRIEHHPEIRSIDDIESASVINFTPPAGFLSATTNVKNRKNEDLEEDLDEYF